MVRVDNYAIDRIKTVGTARHDEGSHSLLARRAAGDEFEIAAGR